MKSPKSQTETQAKIQKLAFVQAPLQAMLNLPQNQAAVWYALLTFQGSNDRCWPTLEAVSKRLNGAFKPKNISKITKALESKGWLKKIRRGHGRSNVYFVVIPEDCLFVPDFNSQYQTLSTKKEVKTVPLVQTKEYSVEDFDLAVGYTGPKDHWYEK